MAKNVSTPSVFFVAGNKHEGCGHKHRHVDTAARCLKFETPYRTKWQVWAVWYLENGKRVWMPWSRVRSAWEQNAYGH